MKSQLVLGLLIAIVLIMACGNEEGKNAKPVEEFSEEEVTKLLNLYEITEARQHLTDFSHMLIFTAAFTNSKMMLFFKVENAKVTKVDSGTTLNTYAIEVNGTSLKGFSRSDGRKKLAFASKQLSSTEAMPQNIVRMMEMIGLAKELNEKLEEANHKVRAFASPTSDNLDLDQHQLDVLKKFRDNAAVVGTYMGTLGAEKISFSAGKTHSSYTDFDKTFDFGSQEVLTPEEWITRMRNNTISIDRNTGRVTR